VHHSVLLPGVQIGAAAAGRCAEPEALAASSADGSSSAAGSPAPPAANERPLIGGSPEPRSLAAGSSPSRLREQRAQIANPRSSMKPWPFSGSPHRKHSASAAGVRASGARPAGRRSAAPGVVPALAQR
jgi:hypothetical protein